MKSFIAPAVFLAAVVGINTLVPAPDVSEGEVAYSFNPGEIRRNICGPVGTNRGSLFRPDIAHLISSAVRADDAAMSESVPLLPGLDSRSFPISTKVPEAQAYYQQGAALLYGFNHWEAIRAFKKAQELDPTCAICHWGEAIAYGPNINAPMDAEGNKKAVAALEKAKALIANASERERDLIMALDTRYKAGAGADRGDMDQKFADAMAALHAKYPDDQDIATIYAEALMDTSPWDYWERDFTTPKPHIKTAIDAIEGVVAKNPDHYGAIHLFIHLYEASSVATKAEPYADKLAGLAPGSGHLVHMPGHIYFRIGRYLDSLETNVVAVKVDEDYLAMTKGSDLYRYGYYPHNVHFVLVSAQMAGDEAISLEYAKKLDALIPVQVVKEAEWIAPIKVAPYFVFAQFAPLDDVLAVEDPGDDVAYLKAMWHYMRGLALAERGDARAAAEQAAIDALVAAGAVSNSGGMPAKTILELASVTIEGRAKQAAGDYEGAIASFRRAVELQDSMPYMEPPFWYYATEQSLGAALYEAGKFSEAEDAFKAALVRHPNSAWSLYGLMKSLEAQDRKGEAAMTAKLLERASRIGENVSFSKL
ncbi:hypothetical protein [Kordiimonas gwangyangensis]|uniref:hypothetical protein n=1 Tax=Kordiimonas gwangyangensis TaxID=288022 RepID=UPI000362D95C|nr:hypothetical protein [Kordiimonas gwangyangensis]